MCAEIPADAAAQQGIGIHTASLYDQARLKVGHMRPAQAERGAGVAHWTVLQDVMSLVRAVDLQVMSRKDHG